MLPDRFRPRFVLPVLAGLSFVSCLLDAPLRPLGAQEVDDPLSPAGRLRVGAAVLHSSADSRFGSRSVDGALVEEVEPLGFELTRDPLGTDVFSFLAPLEEGLSTALQDPDLTVSLGATSAGVRTSTLRIPVDADLGITDWLTVGVSVPLVRHRTEIGVFLASGAGISDLGPAPGGQVVGPSPALFLQSLGGAVGAMEARASEICGADPGSADCAAAQDAAADGRVFLEGLTAAYGAEFFPFEGSDTGLALRDRLSSLTTRFLRHGVASVPATDDLPLAESGLALEDLERLATDASYGFGGDSLRTRQGGWQVGDVEVHGALRLLEGRRTGDPGSLGLSSWLLGAGGRVRLATGTVQDPDLFFDRGSGDGQMDVEARLFGDVGLGGRFGLWTDVRYGLQMEGTVSRRIAAPSAFLPPASSRSELLWDPGDYLAFEAAPRVRLTPELALATRYRLFVKGEDRYRLASTGGSGLPDPGLLEMETEQTVHEAGISVVYSTLRASAAGEDVRPLEARVRYRRAVAGSGGATPKTSRFELGLRLFWELWGG